MDSAFPTYFGPSARPLAGWIHLPAASVATRVLICGPIGYEAHFSYIALRELAHRLAMRGCAVMRFDFYGFGDSSGDDTDGGLVPIWIENVHSAIEELKRRCPGDDIPTLVVGMRLGALLAACAASARTDVTAVAFWAGAACGKSFLREQRALSRMARHAIEGVSNAWGEHSFQANGYVYTDETVRELQALSLAALNAPAERILVLNRCDLPSKAVAPEHWARSGCHVQEESCDGFSEMMQAPWLSVLPNTTIDRLVSWATEYRREAAINCSRTTTTQSIPIGPQALESFARFGADHSGCGVLTEPRAAATTTIVVFVTSTFGYRIGPNRMNVAAARDLAIRGVASFRIDLPGTGDCRPEGLTTPLPPYYAEAACAQILFALDMLEQRGYRKIVLCGICAGATIAWLAACAYERAARCIVINPETFRPIRYEVADHVATLTKRERWLIQLKRARSPRRIAQLLTSRGIRALGLLSEHVSGYVPPFLSRSSLAGSIHAMARKGMEVSVIFSRDDIGVPEFQRRMRMHVRSLTQRGHLSLQFLEGPDHSFTSRAARDVIVQTIAAHVARGEGAIKGLATPTGTRVAALAAAHYEFVFELYVHATPLVV